MSILHIVLSVVFGLMCVALMGVILLQKKRASGLGTMGGMAPTQSYWDKNRGRSAEGKLETYTKIIAALFLILSLVLCVIK